MRLAWKINGALVVVIAGVLAFQAQSRIGRESALFEREIGRDHQVMARSVRYALEDAWDESGAEAAVALAARLDSRDAGVRIRMIVPGGPEVPVIDVAAIPALPDLGSTVVNEAEDPPALYTYVPLRHGGELALIELRESLDSQERYVQETRLRVLGWMVALIVATLGVVMVLVHMLVTRPVSMLMAQAARVGAGDLRPALEGRSNDELGGLGLAFDRMTADLAAAAERLAAEEAAKARTLEQLRHADRLMTVGQLAAGIAHELGTPLNVALVRARMIERGEVASEGDVASYAKTIAEQCDRMAGIIRQLLDFARPRAPRLTDVSPSHLVRQVVGLVSPMARRRGVAVAVAPGEDAPVQVDPGQLEQVLLNLVTNAIHASSEGGVVTLSVTPMVAVAPGASAAERWVRMEVRDRGTGIAPENLARVFEPFFTTKDVGQGTGLGLSVSHGIIREHGGWIDVQSALGEGTAFHVYLRPSGSPTR